MIDQNIHVQDPHTWSKEIFRSKVQWLLLCWVPLLQGEGMPLKKKPQKINLLVIHKQLKSHSVTLATAQSYVLPSPFQPLTGSSEPLDWI